MLAASEVKALYREPPGRGIALECPNDFVSVACLCLQSGCVSIRQYTTTHASAYVGIALECANDLVSDACLCLQHQSKAATTE
jgi:hypothetical protein